MIFFFGKNHVMPVGSIASHQMGSAPAMINTKGSYTDRIKKEENILVY